MSAFTQPETDSEDELPPGWEERATLGELAWKRREQDTERRHVS